MIRLISISSPVELFTRRRIDIFCVVRYTDRGRTHVASIMHPPPRRILQPGRVGDYQVGDYVYSCPLSQHGQDRVPVSRRVKRKNGGVMVNTPCLKKPCQLTFLLCVGWIQTNFNKKKLLDVYWKKHVTKLCKKYPLYLKYRLCQHIPLEIWCEIWCHRLNHQCSTYVLILMNHWRATKTTGSSSSHILFPSQKPMAIIEHQNNL